MVILTSPKSREFAKKVYDSLVRVSGKDYNSVPFTTIDIDYFNNKEIGVQIPENLRKRDVYFIHTFSNDSEYEPNIALMELYLVDDAIRRASANEITYILPHIPYQRQDRKDKPRVPLSARRIMDMLTVYPTPQTRIVTFDMHAGQIQGFSHYPVDNLEALPLFLDYFKNNGFSDPAKVTVVSPDVGGTRRARDFANRLGNGLAIIDKSRVPRSEAEVMNVIGDVNDVAIIIDDLVDSGGTLIKGANLLRERGAKDVYACCTHAVLSPSMDKEEGRITPAEEKFVKSGIKMVATDTIPRTEKYLEDNKTWLDILSVADMTGDAVHRIQTGKSVSELFKTY